ncbi:MAG: hypothetical protein A2504_16040 [Bdellovibrionales bacterium RIFOXYD12_FULL_39_22]|nr:MAG: hypothetical protein A2385_07950 [Bdellovibrionales bacterium RIFOXYB1_FULL_39_21]OFZ43008.1 MAG: hypothetical protein A2485_11275 [Bdellovibrionales bacterium RIFOXYC12_FULL_39_17]OFZ50906.1 MAG: hypothetical protein A2404_06865 [Bdellovibrionales bacterium RIFOXYC1_FULL_39_130]OFZ73641.1 MAG: hypothetical protein A2451_06400 [Bdellovibrionales bacterium RIFOXYC2_FULL_39_8]OFZ78129.1 MAG: hypothetical protein A2560_02035 [Bdellovibrionales bacterium RIFOXYD1_FULL_39_84]OFZ93997.1 MAG:
MGQVLAKYITKLFGYMKNFTLVKISNANHTELKIMSDQQEVKVKQLGLIAIITLFCSCTTSSTMASINPNFPVTQAPQEEDWQFLDLLEKFQSKVPEEKMDLIKSWKNEDLERGRSTYYFSTIEVDTIQTEKDVTVEYSQMLINIPYNKFIRKLPPESWGMQLSEYRGGEVRVVERDSEGRPIRQIERMVLPFNQDMTKAEIINYGTNFSEICWRVYYSDNGSTDADLGSVQFRSFGPENTLVTFHSAHKMRTILRIPVARVIAGPMLRKTFLEHLENYRYIVTR